MTTITNKTLTNTIETAPTTSAAATMSATLGFSATSPFPFAAGPTSLRLRRLRDQRKQTAVAFTRQALRAAL